MGRTALFLIFVAVPIIEIALFVKVGGLIGLWATLAIVVLTALAGTTLMRIQGLQALGRLRAALEAGGNPAGPIAHGALILIAGMLLLTPGFFTDSLGLALLVPALRSRLIRWGASRVTVHTVGGRPPPRHPAAGRDTIDAEYEVLEPRDARDEAEPRGKSGWTGPRR